MLLAPMDALVDDERLPRELWPSCQLLACLRRGDWSDGYLAARSGGAVARLVYLERVAAYAANDPTFTGQLPTLARGVVARTHAHLVTTYDLREHDGALWLMHEHVFGRSAGETLARCHDRDARGVPVASAGYAAECAAQGLAHLHARGEVHGCVSPSHLLLGFGGEVKLARACVREPMRPSGTGADVRRVRFLAPEQAGGAAADARTDVFALGLVLYTLLTGQNPFQASNTYATLDRVKACVVPPPSARQPDVSPALEAVLLRALARAPGDRYSDGAEFASALAAARPALSVTSRGAALGRWLRELFTPEIDPMLASWPALRSW